MSNAGRASVRHYYIGRTIRGRCEDIRRMSDWWRQSSPDPTATGHRKKEGEGEIYGAIINRDRREAI